MACVAERCGSGSRPVYVVRIRWETACHAFADLFIAGRSLRRSVRDRVEC